MRVLALLPLAIVCALGANADGWAVRSSYARIADGVLTVDIPAGKESVDAQARKEIDLSPFAGKAIEVSVRCRGERLSRPKQSWLGLKVMLHYRDESGDQWPQAATREGSFDWQTVTFLHDFRGRRPAKGTLSLGIQNATGKAEFDLSSVKVAEVEPLFAMTNGEFRVKYPSAIAAKPPLRGVMLPARAPVEDDFRTLREWGATLARFQMIRGWSEVNDNQDLAEYDRWLDGKLVDLERCLPWAEKCGIELIVDLHVPPGGRDASHEMNMFHDARYADHFIACWRRIATRFRGRKGVYGYDLINEPTQTRRALPGCDYWNLQRRAAEAVRAIDPDTPIIIESNAWDDPEAFVYLSPLAMDNVIYQAHMYRPHEFTHQGVHGDWKKAKWPDAAKGWDRERIRKTLRPVLEFREKHNARILIGEFSAITWAEGAENYIADCIALFNEYGFDWTYHAYREWNGWSVEHEVSDFATRQIVPSADNPRKRALLSGFGVRKGEF